jgi:esterase/lipase superfamily enzyme
MRNTCCRMGVTVGLFLLAAALIGCGAKPSPTAAKRQAAAKTETVADVRPTSAPRSAPKAARETPAASSPSKAAPVAPLPPSGSAPKAPTSSDQPKTKKMAKKSEPSSGAAPSPPASDGKLMLRKAEPKESGSDKEDAAADANEPYSVVKVYYATDRAPLDARQWQKTLRAGWPLLAGVLAVLAVVLTLLRRRVPRFVRGLAWAALVFVLAFGGLTFVSRWQSKPDVEAIERIYGGNRGQFELGICNVSIPKDHRVGELESPTVLRLEFRPDPERHVVLLSVHPVPADRFYADLRECIGRSSRKETFIFVHGYNVGFENAVRRTGQIAYDLKFEGAAIVYSWPSQEGLFSYTVDENNVDWTVQHLKDFLQDVATRSGAKSIHLVAHSMGNRALTAALRELEMEHKSQCPRFSEVVLTAPDVDADKFRRDLAPAIVKIADRVTLYASSNDKALIASRGIHGYLRAGESGRTMVVVPGIDTVDVSEVDTSFVGHSYYGSSTSVLADLFELMKSSTPADKRTWLHSMQRGALKYWKFLKDKVHDLPSTPSNNDRL